jgi:hypothetical protein
MSNKRNSSEGIAEILRDIEQLKAKTRARDLQALSYLLDMARLEAVRMIDSQQCDADEGGPSARAASR